jgi:hypothetical protein
MKWLLCLVCAALCLFALSCHDNHTAVENSSTAPLPTFPDSDWALLPFMKMDAFNPILQPGPA